MKTKKALKSELNELIASNMTECKATGDAIERVVRSLQFHGAKVNEGRGLSDAGITRKQWEAIAFFKLPFVFSGEVCNFLYDNG